MIARPSSLLVCALTLALAPVSFIPSTSAAEKEEEQTELGKQMDDLGGAWRRVRRQVADPAGNVATAGLVAAMKKGAEAALALTPVRAQDVPEAERPAFLENYRKQMRKLVDLLGQLELALKEDRNADAEKLVGEIGAHQRASHKDFRRPDEG